MLLAGLAFAGTAAGAPEPLSFPESQLEPLAWATLEGWAEDDHLAAFGTFQASCKSLIRQRKWLERRNREASDTRPMRAALTDVCEKAAEYQGADAAAARKFFEDHFRPVKVGKLGEETGLLTGYYEPIIEGSRFPSNEYVVPVYGTPSDLIVGGKKVEPGNGFPNKGRVSRRDGDKIVPYYDRGEIEDGVLAGNGLELCWVKDPIDAFFMQIQGSARIKLDTGKTMRLNYAAHNGHPYIPVGRLLIERRHVPKAEMSMDRIRTWMERDPEQGKALRRENRSYVFMRETGLADDVEPTGAQGVPLTAGRSIAVDKKLHVYGTPFFISAGLPIESEKPVTPFRRLMVAQDTGSAIIGTARADIYFGAGEELGRIAGRIKQQGQFVMLVPKPLDPAVTEGVPPLPIARPRQPDDPILAPLSPSFVRKQTPPAATATAAMAYAPPGAAVGGPAIPVAGLLRDIPLPRARPESSLLLGWLMSLPSMVSNAMAIEPSASAPSFAAAEIAIATARTARSPTLAHAVAAEFVQAVRTGALPAASEPPREIVAAER
jgi:membrane-bound lytic murein transglycosylase A